MPPPSYRAGYDLVTSGDADLSQKATMAAISAALTQYATNTNTSTVHIARRTLATKVLQSPESYGRDFALAVVVTQSAPYTDAVLLAGVNAVWDAMAGA